MERAEEGMRDMRQERGPEEHEEDMECGGGDEGKNGCYEGRL